MCTEQLPVLAVPATIAAYVEPQAPLSPHRSVLPTGSLGGQVPSGLAPETGCSIGDAVTALRDDPFAHADAASRDDEPSGVVAIDGAYAVQVRPQTALAGPIPSVLL